MLQYRHRYIGRDTPHSYTPTQQHNRIPPSPSIQYIQHTSNIVVLTPHSPYLPYVSQLPMWPWCNPLILLRFWLMAWSWSRGHGRRRQGTPPHSPRPLRLYPPHNFSATSVLTVQKPHFVTSRQRWRRRLPPLWAKKGAFFGKIPHFGILLLNR